MIVYTYQCPECELIREEFREMNDDHVKVAIDPCIMCFSPMYKIVDAPAGYVKGTSTPTKNK